MFWKLFNYIQGANSAEKKIPMTVPVTTKVVDSVSFTWFFGKNLWKGNVQSYRPSSFKIKVYLNIDINRIANPI